MDYANKNVRRWGTSLEYILELKYQLERKFKRYDPNDETNGSITERRLTTY